MAKAIVFEKNGKIRLATIVNDQKAVSRENLKDFADCPQKKLEVIPKNILAFCNECAPQILYMNYQGELEAYWDRTHV